MVVILRKVMKDWRIMQTKNAFLLNLAIKNRSHAGARPVTTGSARGFPLYSPIVDAHNVIFGQYLHYYKNIDYFCTL